MIVILWTAENCLEQAVTIAIVGFSCYPSAWVKSSGMKAIKQQPCAFAPSTSLHPPPIKQIGFAAVLVLLVVIEQMCMV
eukprot:6383000-Pyramimonas_sp.AAC.1